MSGASICEAANKEKGMFDSDKSIAQKRDAGIAKEVGKFDQLSLPPVGKVYNEAVLETGDSATRVGRVQAACAAEAGSASTEKTEPLSAKTKAYSCKIEEATGGTCDTRSSSGSTLGSSRAELSKF